MGSYADGDLLGVLFTICQAYEYGHAAFGFSGNIYGATFFMATGFHGFHVIVGTIFLAVCLFRALMDSSPSKQHFRLRGSGLVLALC
jgi:cytochrome c oxidase subunit 3